MVVVQLAGAGLPIRHSALANMAPCGAPVVVEKHAPESRMPTVLFHHAILLLPALADRARPRPAFKGPVLLAKGPDDHVCVPYDVPGRPQESDPQPLLVCSDPGGLRRCGGQGDVLAGTAPQGALSPMCSFNTKRSTAVSSIVVASNVVQPQMRCLEFLMSRASHVLLVHVV